MITWKEFKDFVEKELAENGKDENIEISFIDVYYPDLEEFENGTYTVQITDALTIW